MKYALASAFLAAFSMSFLEMIRFHYQKPKICISEIYPHRFERSIRVQAIIRNKGGSVARYVKPLITMDESLSQLICAEYSSVNEKWITCSKGDFTCDICEKREFLCPYPFKVEKEYLCWTVPEVDAGRGLDDLPYRHVTNIAPNDSQKVIIGDIYRSEYEKLCIIKIASEYGIDKKPRICYKVDLDKGATIGFTLELVGEGFDPVKERVELKITRDELKVVFRGTEELISEFKDVKTFPYHGKVI
jgi:hypothetical protein